MEIFGVIAFEHCLWNRNGASEKNTWKWQFDQRPYGPKIIVSKIG